MFSGKGLIPACSSGNVWAQSNVLSSLLLRTGGGRGLFKDSSAGLNAFEVSRAGSCQPQLLLVTLHTGTRTHAF